MSEHLRGFLWVLLAFCGAVTLVPQLLTRSRSGNRIFDPYGTRGDEAAWIDRGTRISFLGGLIVLATVLYLTSS